MTKMTHRMMPPADGLRPTITVNGRTYTCALGATIDVPDADSDVMIVNGWTRASDSGVGNVRPQKALKNQVFHDTTLNLNIFFDGKVWRNPNTGAAV